MNLSSMIFKNYNFGKKVAIFFTGLATIVFLSKDAGIGKLEEFVKTFPTNIPGACEVKKYPFKNSKKTIIHIFQVHYKDYMKKIHTELDQLNSVQKDIYEILNFLIERKKINFVGLELVPKDYSGKIKKEDLIKRQYEELTKKVGGRLYAAGAGKKLIVEGKLKLKPTEMKAQLAKAVDCSEKMGAGMFYFKTKCYMKDIFDNREDVLLKIVSEDKEQISVVVYGGLHALGGKKCCGEEYNLKGRESEKDNIYQWNQENPDKRISLIEIIPKNYEKCGENFAYGF